MTFLWSADSATDMIYRLDPTNGAVLQSFAAPTSSPNGLAIDANGDLWHSSSVSPYTIYRLNPTNLAVLQSFSPPALWPYGLGFNAAGDLWHSDAGNDTIYRLNPTNGAVLQSFAAPAAEPRGLTVDSNGHIWVSSLISDLIYRLNPSNGSVLQSFASPGPSPAGLAFDVNGYLWNSDPTNDMIYRLNPANGAVLQSFASGTLPTGLSWGEDLFNPQPPPFYPFLWMSDTNTDLIYKVNPDDGSVIASIPAPAGAGRPVAVDANNDLWISDELSDVIYKLNPLNGDVINSFAAPGGETRGLSFDLNGDLWSSDTGTDMIYKLDSSNGSVLQSFAAPGTPYPSDLAFASDGDLWVLDTTANAIYRVNPTNGSVISSVPTVDFPTGLAFDPNGHLWCIAYTSDTAHRIDPSNGSSLQSFPTPAGGPWGVSWGRRLPQLAPGYDPTINTTMHDPNGVTGTVTILHRKGRLSDLRVVFLHGRSGTSQAVNLDDWTDDFFRFLASKRFKTHSLDAGGPATWGSDTAINEMLNKHAGGPACPYIGFSMGACNAANMARIHPTLVNRLVLIAPALDLQHFVNAGGDAAAEINAIYGGNHAARSPVNFANQLSGIPIQIHYGSADTVINTSAPQTFATAHGNTEVIEHVGYDHITIWDAVTEYADEIKEFLRNG